MKTIACFISQSKISSYNDLEQLFDKVSYNNVVYDLDGCLIHTPDGFIGILEGEKEKLDMVLSKIQTDQRNTQVKLLAYGLCEEKLFNTWYTFNNSFKEDSKTGQLNSFQELESLFSKGPKHLVKELALSFYKNQCLDYSHFWAGK